MEGSPFLAGNLFGGSRPRLAVAAEEAPNGGAGAQVIDARDRSDRGPTGFFDDPLLIVVLIAGLATGIIGFRFHWGGGSAGASAKVDVGDEAASLVGHALFTIAFIIILKTVVADRVPIPSVKKAVAAI